MYKTPTFVEPQQYNRPLSTGQLSAFIIQTGTSVELKKRENRDDIDSITNERLRTLWYY
jgi:hypothetical protein